MKRLIIDAGSTKMEWAFLNGKKTPNRFTTDGFNPNYADPKKLNEIIAKVELPKADVDEIYYYGSGCLKADNALMVREALQKYFPNSIPIISNDMMGAAHALLGHEKGIACILGTGANSCLYDGETITDQAVSLGYLVGDEGSGCYIGRKLARAYFYDLMPLELKLSLEEYYHLDINEFIENVYHKPEASRYLADVTKFAGDHIDHPFIKDLVKGCFSDFIQAFVLRYKDCHKLRVCFVGSVAFYFQTLLYESLSDEGLTMGKVMRSPMDGLIQMYS